MNSTKHNETAEIRLVVRTKLDRSLEAANNREIPRARQLLREAHRELRAAALEDRGCEFARLSLQHEFLRFQSIISMKCGG